MPTIYTVGLQRVKLADVQEMVSALDIEQILDWRSKPDGRLNPPTLERAFPNKYKYVGKSCNEGNITDKALEALSKVKKVTLLLFHRELPENCPRHNDLAISMRHRHSIDIGHVWGNEVVNASDLQRAMDADDSNVTGRVWKQQQVATPQVTPVKHPAAIKSMNDLGDRAMLVRLSVRMPGFERQNKKVSKEIADKYGADETMGRFVESLIAKEAMARLKQIESSGRQEFYRRTLPWDDNGTRIASSPAYMDLVAFVRALEGQWDPAVEAFCNDWEAHVDEAKRKRNGLFRAEQYMSREEVRKRFEFIWRVSPVATEGDFRCKISEDELRVIREQNAELLRESLAASMADVWHRLKKVVSDFRDRMKAATDQDKKFHDTAVTNITELLAIVPSLNLTGNPDVARFCADIQRDLTTTEPQTLREDPKAREDVMNRADEILSKMSAFI